MPIQMDGDFTSQRLLLFGELLSKYQLPETVYESETVEHDGDRCAVEGGFGLLPSPGSVGCADARDWRPSPNVVK